MANDNEQNQDKSQPEINNDHFEALQKQVADNLAGWQRALADYQNLKKEWQQRQSEFTKNAKDRFLTELMPVYDHLKKAFEVKPEENDCANWITGIEQIKGQLDSLLKQWKVEAIPTVGEVFNPEIHEAVHTDTTGEKDMVTAELQGGYMCEGRLLYPARVVVGTGQNSTDKS